NLPVGKVLGKVVGYRRFSVCGNTMSPKLDRNPCRDGAARKEVQHHRPFVGHAPYNPIDNGDWLLRWMADTFQRVAIQACEAPHVRWIAPLFDALRAQPLVFPIKLLGFLIER